jgi:hypothetical protein
VRGPLPLINGVTGAGTRQRWRYVTISAQRQ